MSNDSKEVRARDAKIQHVRAALEREIGRALRAAPKIVNGCDLTPPYFPDLRVIKSELKALCAAEQKVQQGVNSLQITTEAK